MSIDEIIQEIKAINYLSVPKTYKLHDWLEHEAYNEHQRIRCTHEFADPLARQNPFLTQLLRSTSQLQGLIDFYKICDGAKLFNLKYELPGWTYWLARYEIPSIARLVEIQEEILQTHEYYLKESVKEPLNYIAFCEFGDGHMGGLSLEDGHVFFLDISSGYYPLGSEIAEEYNAYIASSFGDWLMQLVDSGGWDGMGGQAPPILTD